MSLRDIVLFLVVLGGLPFMVVHPYIGVLYFVWLGVMNPHRLAWGVAFDFPFSMIVALATLLGVVVTRDKRQLKGKLESALLILFTIWTSVTTMFAFHPDASFEMWERVVKIQLMVFVTLLVFDSRKHVELLV